MEKFFRKLMAIPYISSRMEIEEHYVRFKMINRYDGKRTVITPPIMRELEEISNNTINFFNRDGEIWGSMEIPGL